LDFTDRHYYNFYYNFDILSSVLNTLFRGIFLKQIYYG
jgi:hypothetical protein